MKKYHAPFEHHEFYHIYNRGNNKENLFREDENYAFFLDKWEKYLLNYTNIWTYCLMPNHFHVLEAFAKPSKILAVIASWRSNLHLKALIGRLPHSVRNDNRVLQRPLLLKIKDADFFPEEADVNKFLENQFKRLFSSYTLSFNKVYDRTGSLFQKRFKRILLDSQSYLLTLIHYIHHNPIHHNFTEDFTDWTYSSYSAITGERPTKVHRDEVLDLFGGIEAFVNFHNQMKDYKQIKHLIIERK